MDFSFTDEQKMLRDNIVKFAQRELCEGAMERDRDQTFSPELWRRCADIGIQGLPVPEEYGGSGVDSLSCAIALEARATSEEPAAGFRRRSAIVGTRASAE